MDLVTVTCNRDFNSMLLQAESISMYLDPCTHWVVVNEVNPDKDFWKNSLQPFYTKHKLNLIFPEGLFLGRGWITQQTYKFWIYKLINDDYLILDSKNFFIRSSNINEWTNFLDIALTFDINELTLTSKMAEIYSNYFQAPACNKSLRIETPFLFEKRVLDSISNFDEFLIWFNDNYGYDNVNRADYQSEFLCYSLLAYKLGLLDKNINDPKPWRFTYHDIAWPGNKKSIYDYIELVKSSPKIKIAGVHRDKILESSDEEIQYLNIWLASKNFQITIKKS